MTDYSECVFLYDWNVWRKIIIYIKWTQTRPSVCWLICSHDILVYALKDQLEKYSITDSFAKDFSLIFVMPYHSAVICKCLITTHMKTCSSLWKSLTTSSMPKSRGSIQLVVLSSKSSIHDLDLHGIFRMESLLIWTIRPSRQCPLQWSRWRFQENKAKLQYIQHLNYLAH